MVVIHEGGDDLVATLGDCLIVILSKGFTVAAVHAIGAAFTSLLQRHQNVAYFSLIERGRLRLQDGARAGMARVIGRHTRDLRCAAILLEGGGFSATAVRSIITAVHVASLASHPLRVHSDLAAALSWLEAHPGEGAPERSVLEACVQRLRARMK